MTAVTVLPARAAAVISRSAAEVICLSGAAAEVAAVSFASALARVAQLTFAAPPWRESAAQARQLVDRMLADAGLSGFVLSLAPGRPGLNVVAVAALRGLRGARRPPVERLR